MIWQNRCPPLPCFRETPVSTYPWLKTFVLAVATLQVVAMSARADDIRFTTMMLSPYGFKDTKGANSGYLFDIANAIGIEASLTIVNQLAPVKRLHQQLVKGAVDCTLAARIPITEVYQLVEPIGISVSLVVIPAAGIKLEKYEDLVGRRIAVVQGTLGAYAKFATDERLEKYMTSGYRENMLMLNRGRVDAVFGAWGSLMFNNRKLGFTSESVGDPLILSQTPMWLVCSNNLNDASKLKRLKQATRRLRENGTITSILSSYIGRTLESAFNKAD
ncbi:MAG: transporter substrate-binding domain-containing protein [Alphaproteobacteria bacterium]|nr:transporter substrate-binding domain-containing protein [Alphaproteobacteria bacterium]MBT4543665.1 transporter substrate-binding domain-containing protein [Alphaproteobacteria bacterium]